MRSVANSRSEKRALTSLTHALYDSPLVKPLKLPQIRHPPCRQGISIWRNFTVFLECSLLFRSQLPKQRRDQLRMMCKVLHHEPPRRRVPGSRNAKPPCWSWCGLVLELPLRAAEPATTLLAKQTMDDVNAWYSAFARQNASMPDSAVLTTRQLSHRVE